MMLKRIASSLIFLLVLAGCQTAGTPPARETPSPAGPLAFRASLAGTPATWTILGSLHLGTPDMYPLPEALTREFAQAGILVLEADLGKEPDPGLLMSRIQLPPGKTLSAVIPASTREELRGFLPKLGLRLQDLEPFQPWYVDMTIALQLIQESGLQASLGIDRHFYSLSRQKGMPLRALESMEYQLGILASDNLEEQVLSLNQTLKQAKDFPDFMSGLVSAWKSGDEETLKKAYLDAMTEVPKAYDRLIRVRNAEWTDQMVSLSEKPEKYFLVVGVAHLIGPDSLVKMLKDRGFTLERL